MDTQTHEDRSGPTISPDPDSQEGVREIPFPGAISEEVREFTISPTLARTLAPYQQAVAEAQAVLNGAVEIALAAMGVEGEGWRVEIHPDRLVVRRPVIE